MSSIFGKRVKRQRARQKQDMEMLNHLTELGNVVQNVFSTLGSILERWKE